MSKALHTRAYTLVCESGRERAAACDLKTLHCRSMLLGQRVAETKAAKYLRYEGNWIPIPLRHENISMI